MSLNTRLQRIEDALIPPAVRAADARMQVRICAELHAVLTGAPDPPATAQSTADVALLADYARQCGPPDPPDPDPVSVAWVLDWLANCATMPERIPLGYQLADWANAQIAAGRDPDAELARLFAERWAGQGEGVAANGPM